MYSKEFKEKAEIRNQDIRSLFFAFLNRARFKYTLGNIFEYMIRCLCFRDIDDKEDRQLQHNKKHFLFKKAEEKFMQELDVVRIVKTLRKFKMLA